MILTGCSGPSGARPDSDSDQFWDGKAPVDTAVYDITGVVTDNSTSIVRQEAPASGSVAAINGYASGSFTGPIESGKSVIRLRVTHISANRLAGAGSSIIVKSTDTKAVALYAGDTVNLRCRIDSEFVAAVQGDDKLTEAAIPSHEALEFDFCRLRTPVVVPGE
jgi:hypothetical protein